MTEIIVVTSGKGGVGKTTTSASLACGLARRGKRVAVIDFDIGLRNLDLVMGCERRVVYDFVNVINGDCTLKQALIKDKRIDTLFVLAASQTRDKDALSAEGVRRVLDDLIADGFDYIICDSPAGIEKGAHLAMYLRRPRRRGRQPGSLLGARLRPHPGPAGQQDAARREGRGAASPSICC